MRAGRPWVERGVETARLGVEVERVGSRMTCTARCRPSKNWRERICVGGAGALGTPTQTLTEGTAGRRVGVAPAGVVVGTRNRN